MSGLIFVPLPVIYTFGYIGLISAHLTLRAIINTKSDLI